MTLESVSQDLARIGNAIETIAQTMADGNLDVVLRIKMRAGIIEGSHSDFPRPLRYFIGSKGVKAPDVLNYRGRLYEAIAENISEGLAVIGFGKYDPWRSIYMPGSVEESYL